jgi:hypothetical protein
MCGFYPYLATRSSVLADNFLREAPSRVDVLLSDQLSPQRLIHHRFSPIRRHPIPHVRQRPSNGCCWDALVATPSRCGQRAGDTGQPGPRLGEHLPKGVLDPAAGSSDPEP